MAIPVYLWLEDDSGRKIKGSVDIQDREGSIEVIEFMHSIEQPIDKLTGKTTAKRICRLHHCSFKCQKENLEKQRYGTDCQMKRLFYLLPLLVAVSTHVLATEMTGFATQYYNEDDSLAEISTTLPLSPTITIGKKTVQMEVTPLVDISSTTVQKGSSARWVCLHDDDGTNYWFISDNEMGAGLLTALAIAQDGIHKECAKTTEHVSVSVANVPLLNATHGNLVELLGKKEIAKNNAMLFYQETPVKNGFIRSNTVSYYFDGEKVRGVIIGQITSN